MAQDRISPEEKLLELIKTNKPKIEDRAKLLGKEKPKKFSFDRFKSVRFKLKTVLILIIILLCYFIGYRYRQGAGIKNPDFFSKGINIEKEQTPEQPLEIIPYSYYSNDIGGKSLFKPLVIEKTTLTSRATEKIEDLCKNYQLKGVILGEKPEAFIEDSLSHRTFTVTVGDTIGKVEVRDIKEGRVRLGYEDETYDLSF